MRNERAEEQAMTQQMVTQFLLGLVVMASVVAGLFFLRFWRKTRDRLFLIFALAFWILALNWALLALINPMGEEKRSLFYVLRLVAFILIIYAIIDKNRTSRTRTP